MEYFNDRERALDAVGLRKYSRLGQQATTDSANRRASLALDLDRPLLHELVPAVAHLVDREGLEARPDAAPVGTGAGSAPCSSRSSRPSGSRWTETAGRGSRPPSRASGSRGRWSCRTGCRSWRVDVDVDPLVVAGDLGELVDVLGHLAPVAGTDGLAQSAFSSSIPFTVVVIGRLAAASAAVVPRLRLRAAASARLPSFITGCPWVTSTRRSGGRAAAPASG